MQTLFILSLSLQHIRLSISYLEYLKSYNFNNSCFTVSRQKPFITMNKTIKRVAQKKNGKTWIDTYIDNDAASVYKSLSHDLIAKKINACTYIKSIKRIQNYDGTNTIIVTYAYNTRSIYTIDNVW